MSDQQRIARIFPNVLLSHSKDIASTVSSNLGYDKYADLDIPITSLPRLKPALSPSVQLSLTVVYISLYGLLFFVVYIQLWMIWYYRHKRFSYQTVFLFLCLVWSGLRTTLFSFYVQDCDQANDLPWVFYWLLYCFPVCLQFTTLCLLVLFFAQVVFKARAKYEPSKFKRPLRILVFLAIILFVVSNIACAMVIKYHEKNYSSIPLELIYIRVAINDSLFIIFGILLSFCIYKMSKMSSSSLVLEAKGTSMCQAIAACVVILMLFTSRAIYNFISIYPALKTKVPDFGYDWVNVSDQADFNDLSGGYEYLSFGIVLFVWEVLPTFVVVLFFRVKRAVNAVALNDLSSHSHSSKVFFFDNPRRYDSDDDLTREDPHSINYSIHNSYNSMDTGGISHGTPILTPNGRITPRGGTPRGTPKTAYGSIMSRSMPSSRQGASPSPVMYNGSQLYQGHNG
ncbi:G protein-coupled receptor 137Ba-like [Haliotis cracherodii]|uniref:G protein-coupled receptor 137Ba-like n=1 Tax=Haliotis cracherodii TaxID=6455 RepID=UPI0039ECB256